MTAVVAPIGVKDAEFSLIRVTAFLVEVIDHFPEVIGIHRQPHFLAIWSEVLFLELPEAFKQGHRRNLRLFGLYQF